MQTLACKLALKKSVLKYLALYKKKYQRSLWRLLTSVGTSSTLILSTWTVWQSAIVLVSHTCRTQIMIITLLFHLLRNSKILRGSVRKQPWVCFHDLSTGNSIFVITGSWLTMILSIPTSAQSSLG